MPKRKTTTEFKQEVAKIAPGYKVNGKYINTHTKINMVCPHGHHFTVDPDGFLHGNHRCSWCSGHHIWSLKEFNKYVNKIGYVILDPKDFKNMTTKIWLKCLTCNYKWYVRPTEVTQGERCPRCMRKIENKHESKTRTFSNKQFLKQIRSLSGNKYHILTKYKNDNTPIKVKHNKCGYSWWVKPSSFKSSLKRGYGCPNCYSIWSLNSKYHKKFKLKRFKKYKKQVIALVGNKYSILTKFKDYKNGKQPILFKHNDCNHINRISFDNFIYCNVRCKYCSIHDGYSKPELTIEKILKGL